MAKTGKASTAESRREYQREYYQKHREKAKEYQRIYNRTHKKAKNPQKGPRMVVCPREEKQMAYTASDIIHLPAVKAARVLDQILAGERWLTV